MENETKKMSVPFTQVANSLLNNDEISFKAKGVYAFLYSKPSGWRFSAERIAKQSKDGRSAVLSALKELEDICYLRREKQKDGTILYVLTYEPECENLTLGSQKPEFDFRTVGKPHCAETAPISNKEDIVINNNSKKEATPSEIAQYFFAYPEPVIQELLENGLPDKTVRAEVAKFISYWTEPNKSGKKQRWELEKVFDVKRRLGTWFRNYVKFNTVEKTSNNKITFVG